MLDTKTISKKFGHIHDDIKQMLMEEYPNLYFYICPSGKLTTWIRTPKGKDGAGIHMKLSINVGQILSHEVQYLEELNKKVEPVHKEPDKYFYCTECGRVLPKEELADVVFAGYYCKDCEKNNPEVASLIKESHKKGFYD